MLHALQVFASVLVFFFYVVNDMTLTFLITGYYQRQDILFTFVKVFPPESIFSAFPIECSNRDYKCVFSRGISLFVFPL